MSEHAERRVPIGTDLVAQRDELAAQIASLQEAIDADNADVAAIDAKAAALGLDVLNVKP